jgi:hypothetical protein
LQAGFRCQICRSSAPSAGSPISWPRLSPISGGEFFTFPTASPLFPTPSPFYGQVCPNRRRKECNVGNPYFEQTKPNRGGRGEIASSLRTLRQAQGEVAPRNHRLPRGEQNKANSLQPCARSALDPSQAQGTADSPRKTKPIGRGRHAGRQDAALDRPHTFLCTTIAAACAVGRMIISAICTCAGRVAAQTMASAISSPFSGWYP